jgi:hypothetical protein
VTLCYPLSYGSCAAPSKEDGGTLEKGTGAYLAPAKDVVVTSDQWGGDGTSSPVPVSPQPRFNFSPTAHENKPNSLDI